jgi:hypothetical protein
VQALADSGVLWILVFTALPVLYLLPTLVGAIRRVDGLALVIGSWPRPSRVAASLWVFAA